MTIAGDPVKKIALALEHPGMVRTAQPRRRFAHCIKHALQIEFRAADDLEHVSGGGLLLPRLRQFVGKSADFSLQIGKG